MSKYIFSSAILFRIEFPKSFLHCATKSMHACIILKYIILERSHGCQDNSVSIEIILIQPMIVSPRTMEHR